MGEGGGSGVGGEELPAGGQKEQVAGRQEGGRSPNLVEGLVKELLEGGQEQ